MIFPRKKIGKQGRWPQALALIAAPVVLIFAFRWVVFEPFVIPSESMLPNLLVHDHILVSKSSYGIKIPFSDSWLLRFSGPQRGDVVVFKYPLNTNVFFIKRVVGLPHDKISVQNGQVIVNDQPWTIQGVTSGAFKDEDSFSYFLESIPSSVEGKALSEHLIRLSVGGHIDPNEVVFEVPEGQYLVLGDNRDQSQDSRFWGFVDDRLLVGQAKYIWLSCENTLEATPMLCDPATLRADRIFTRIRGAK
ncbi:signal peptidase I [Pseudobdellovibrio exovorus]|uniref:Signal peptidase I n=1 Tax=Pseudobdellovibrio exovorus JSS TaxID=1184267 RepID=M4V6Z9_9BACT|nr:signal peptidase I [Pseudobdellovibrio exovorus]AGH94963.1 hypothetical protein A11Q_743 [Pseudobdellovibrio exovorus JSS]